MKTGIRKKKKKKKEPSCPSECSFCWKASCALRFGVVIRSEIYRGGPAKERLRGRFRRSRERMGNGNSLLFGYSVNMYMMLGGGEAEKRSFTSFACMNGLGTGSGAWNGK